MNQPATETTTPTVERGTVATLTYTTGVRPRWREHQITGLVLDDGSITGVVTLAVGVRGTHVTVSATRVTHVSVPQPRKATP